MLMKKFINNLQALNCINTLSILGDNISITQMTKNNKFYQLTKQINI